MDQTGVERFELVSDIKLVNTRTDIGSNPAIRALREAAVDRSEGRETIVAAPRLRGQISYVDHAEV